MAPVIFFIAYYESVWEKKKKSFKEEAYMYMHAASQLAKARYGPLFLTGLTGLTFPYEDYSAIYSSKGDFDRPGGHKV